MSAADDSAIAYVACLRHRKQPCKCERCSCLARVVALAREMVETKTRRKKVRDNQASLN